MRRSKGLSFYKKRRKMNSKILKEISGWVIGILLSIFLAFITVYSIGMTTSVIGVSMEPSLYNGQTIFINRLSYKLSGPKIGDVIVFLPNGNEKSHYYVKRVVATAGDTVKIVGGILYVNGEPQEENEFDKMADAGIAENEIVLQKDECFVLGDNRNNSEDSRSANVGIVKEKDIVGRAWFHWGCPESGIGFVK